MRKHLIVLAVAVIAGALAGPGVAAAVPPGITVHFAALTEQDGAGKPVSVPIGRGETVPVTVGVAFLSDAPAKGAVLSVYVSGDLKLPHTLGNCWYYEGRDYSGAWCSFDRTLQFGTAYAVAVPVSAVAGAQPSQVGKLSFDWYPADYGSDDGGIEGLARERTPIVTKPEKGTGDAVTLTVTSKLTAQDNPPTGAVDLHLTGASSTTTPPTTAATTTPATPPSATTGAQAGTTTAPPADGTGGGGLPITGSDSVAYAAGGAVLVLAGLAGFAATRRRRTKFVA